MLTEKITDETLEQYESLMPPDVADDIGRTFIRALAAGEKASEGAGAVMVWEVKNLEDEEDTEAEIKWLKISDEEAGKALLETYTKEAGEEGVKRTFFEWKERDAKTEELLIEAGFDLKEKEGRDLFISLKEISRLKIAKKATPPYIIKIEELRVRDFRKGITSCLLEGHKGLLEDLAYLPMNWFDQECSCVTVTDEEVNGLFLIHRTASGMLVPELLFAAEPDSRTHLLNLLRFSIQQAAIKYQEDTMIILRRRDESVRALVDYLFPGRKGDKVISGRRTEK